MVVVDYFKIDYFKFVFFEVDYLDFLIKFIYGGNCLVYGGMFELFENFFKYLVEEFVKMKNFLEFWFKELFKLYDVCDRWWVVLL